MSERPEYIQLEAGEDTASVRDRLSFLRGKRVLIIWPEDGTVLARKLDLVLIQREAMRRAIRLALVTHDPEVIQHAAELNISTFETIGASERKRWKRGRSKAFTPRARRLGDQAGGDSVESAGQPNVDDAPRRFPVSLLAAAVVGILLLGAVYVILPSATVSLTPAQRRLNTEVEITADPQLQVVDVENRIIPAARLRVQIEDAGTVETTGSRNLGDTLATGSVVFINRTNGAVTIPAGTIVTTSSGTPIAFQTTAEASLAAGEGLQIEVPIEALAAASGEVGNVDSQMINTVVGDLAAVVAVRNISPTIGGANRVQRTVTTADQERLLLTLRQQLQAKAYLEMEPRLTSSQFIVLETIRIAEERADWTTFSAEPGDSADTLSLTMRAVIEALAVDQQYGDQIAYAELSRQIPAGQVIQPASVSYERGPIQAVETETGKIRMTMRAAGLVTTLVDTEALRNRLAGLSLNDAMAYLVSEIPLTSGSPPQITLSPDWFGQMPLLPFRISVQLQDVPT
jgi:hypothetical protein